MSLARDTQPTRLDDTHWSTPIRPGWDIRGNANGGYLMALCARAMAAQVDRPDPITVTAHYLAPGKEGPAELEVQTIRAGRQMATVGATLRSEGRVLLQLLGAFGDLSARGDFLERIVGGPPDLPPPDECFSVQPENAVTPALFRSRVEARLHPDDGKFMQGMPSGESVLRGWFRLANDEPMDTIAMLLAADAYPPTIFNAGLPLGWAPTIELTVHVRARPASGWLRVLFTHRFATSGFIEEDGEIWDSTGKLVAQSRQLALLPRGQAPG